jgi:hypothetical protein
MGMFDAIVFPRPIACAGCGAPIESTQSHELGQTLDTYRVGDAVEACPIATGVLEERLYCHACKGVEQRVYFTIWHSLLTGVYGSQEEAEAHLFGVDRADILNYLIAHQKEERRLGGLLRSALGLVSDYAEYLEAPDKAEFLDEPLGGILHLGLKDHLKSEYPLSSIVAHLRAEMGKLAEEGSPFE